MPKIVILDAHTTSQLAADSTAEGNEVNWQPLAELGELVIHDRTAPRDVIERIGDAAFVLTNKTPIDAVTLASCPNLKYVGVLATGVNVVDIGAARANDITVTNIPGYSTPSVAQHVFAMLLELCNRTAEHDRAVHEGQWANCKDFSFTTGPLIELSGKTLGIVGMGAIGQATARVGHALGMSIAAHSRTKKELEYPVQWLGVDELFATADVVSLHCPLTPRTQGHVNATRLASMKPSAYLINTGRGQLIDEPALAEALSNGTIAGAGLDVLCNEPPSADNPLLTAPNCIITPHIAWATIASRRRLLDIAASNVRAYLDDKPINVVS
ncbi:MAG: D-2-hydroxyacid dehydrogenase [Phycisphaeraceae bacterium]